MEIFIVIGAAIAVVLLTSLFKQADWNPKHKTLLATVLSVIAASVALLFGVDVSTLAGVDVMQLVLSIYGSSQLFYNFILHGTKMDDTLAAVGAPAYKQDLEHNAEHDPAVVSDETEV